MRFSAIFALGSLCLNQFTEAAPTISSSASGIIKRSQNGVESIDFEYVLDSIQAINERYLNGGGSFLQKRDDDQFIDQLMMEFHKHNLMDEFVDQLTSAPHLQGALEDSAVHFISSGQVDEPLLINSLRASGKLGIFFDSVLNSEELNDELFNTAQSILQTVDKEGDYAAKNSLDETEPFIHTIYSDTMSPKRRSVFDEERFLESHGMSKRDLISSIFSIVKAISNSGLVQKIIHSIIGNQSLVQYSINLFGKIFRSINWGKLFTAIKNSGLIEKIFTAILRLLAGLFAGSKLSSIIGEIFGGGANSTHKSFLASLLSSGVEVGSGLYSSLNKSSSSGLVSDLSNSFKNPGSPYSYTPSASTRLYSAATSTSPPSPSTSSSGGLLLILFPSLFSGKSSSGSTPSSSSSSPSTTNSGSSKGFLLTLLGFLFKPKSATNNQSSSGQSSGGFFSRLFGSLNSKPSSSTPTSSTPTSSSSNSSGKGFLATLFDSLYNKPSSSSSLSSSSNSAGSTATGFSLGALIGSLFKPKSGGTSGSSSPLAQPSSVFSSAKACCCSPNRIKQRAMKRALTAKLQRSFKRSLAAGDLELNEGLMKFFLK